MTIEDNLYEKSIKILTDLIAFKTVSGQDNSELINYCEKILNDLKIETFKVFDENKIRKLFDTMPRLRHEQEVTNPKTGVKSKVTFEGLNDFFGLASPIIA